MTFKLNANTFNQLIRSRDKALYEVGLFLASQLKRNVKVDKGQQRASINVDRSQISEGVVEVGTNVIQARIEEFGRKPGKFPNLDALVGWTARKGFHRAGQSKKYGQLGKDKKYTTRGRLSAKTKEEIRAKFITYRVGLSISKNGIKKTEVYSKTFKKHKERMEKLFIRKLKKYAGII